MQIGTVVAFVLMIFKDQLYRLQLRIRDSIDKQVSTQEILSQNTRVKSSQ